MDDSKEFLLTFVLKMLYSTWSEASLVSGRVCKTTYFKICLVQWLLAWHEALKRNYRHWDRPKVRDLAFQMALW